MTDVTVRRSRNRGRVASAVLGALLAGVVGATAGSWLGGRDLTPLPTAAQALVLAQEITPGVSPAGGTERQDYAYGTREGDEGYGPGFVELRYEPDRDEIDTPLVCAPDQRRHAESQGWQHFRAITGYPCDSWSAERGDLVVDHTQDAAGQVLTFYRATPAGVRTGTLTGVALAALIGACTFFFLHGHRLLLRLAIPAGIVLLPAAAIYAVILLAGGHDGPTPPFWTIWPNLAGVLIPR